MKSCEERACAPVLGPCGAQELATGRGGAEEGKSLDGAGAMKIRLAQTAGFCMGVRRAVDMVLDLQRRSPPLPIVTYGPLIHNPQTLELLVSRGITCVDSLDEVNHGTVVIRAHGISPQERKVLDAKGLTVIDATCPRVSRVQAVIRKHAAKGHFCVIVGDQDHPEVRGLMGFAAAGGLVIPDADCKGALNAVPPSSDLCVVAQTTQEPELLESVVQLLSGRCPNIHVYNTICDSTKRRQAEVKRLAAQSDLIIVVGGRGSGNTRRLVKVAEAHHTPTIHVETAEEIEPAAVTNARVIGVTAGASTPNWQIRRVIDKLREIGMSRRAAPLKRIRRAIDIAVMTYCWAALGGGGLAATCLVLQGHAVKWLPVAVTMLFVFSMHLLNRIRERSGAVRFNTPEIAAFYNRHGPLLTALGWTSSFAAVILSSWMGTITCLLLLAMVITGRLYTERIIPEPVRQNRRWRSLKDLPGSKTPLVAMGWAVAAAVLPVIGFEPSVSMASLSVAFLFAAAMVFWRTAMSDLLDIQGDRIVGRETIPILIGERRTRLLLGILLPAVGCLLVGAAATNVIPGLGLWLLVNVLTFGALFVVYRRRSLVDRLWFEGLIDGNFVFAGILSLVYSVGWR